MIISIRHSLFALVIALGFVTSACSVTESQSTTTRKEHEEPHIDKVDPVLSVRAGGFWTKKRHGTSDGAPDYFSYEGRINPGFTKDTEEVIFRTAESMTFEGIERFSCDPEVVKFSDLKNGSNQSKRRIC